MNITLSIVVLGLLSVTAMAEPQGGPGSIKLDSDDIQVLADLSDSIVENRPGIPHGKVELIEYDSTTVGTKRKANVYLPPNYSEKKKYPVLYLLHGIGGDEMEWMRFATPNLMLDNLIADKKALPMIIVMPNGRAQKDDRPVGDVFRSAPAFAVFEQDLLKDLIPAIESKYGVRKEQKHRAVAGLSMGGGQSLNFGLAHQDVFGYIGGFSSAPNTKAPDLLIPDVAACKKNLKLLYISCGNKDGLIGFSQKLHRFAKANDIPHIWNVDSHAHDATTWRNNLYHFVQKAFR